MEIHNQPLPTLPIEVWVRILGSITEYRYLPRTWLNSRCVSLAFKAATEMAFIDVYLPQMRICVELAEIMELGYDGLSRDREFINFREFPAHQTNNYSRIPAGLRRRLEQQTERAWQKEHESYEQSVLSCAPRLLYHVWIVGYVEDPVFPDLQVDTAARKLSFRWKPMLSTMFGEVEYRKWLFKKTLDNIGLGEAGGIADDTGEAQRVLARNIEMHVRKLRMWNSRWDKHFSSWRRQEWQLDALLAYRGDGLTKLDLEEGQGKFYEYVKPTHVMVNEGRMMFNDINV